MRFLVADASRTGESSARCDATCNMIYVVYYIAKKKNGAGNVTPAVKDGAKQYLIRSTS